MKPARRVLTHAHIAATSTQIRCQSISHTVTEQSSAKQ